MRFNITLHVLYIAPGCGPASGSCDLLTQYVLQSCCLGHRTDPSMHSGNLMHYLLEH